MASMVQPISLIYKPYASDGLSEGSIHAYLGDDVRHNQSMMASSCTNQSSDATSMMS